MAELHAWAHDSDEDMTSIFYMASIFNHARVCVCGCAYVRMYRRSHDTMSLCVAEILEVGRYIFNYQALFNQLRQTKCS